MLAGRGGEGERMTLLTGVLSLRAITYAVVTVNDSIYLNEALPFNHCLPGNDNTLMIAQSPS